MKGAGFYLLLSKYPSPCLPLFASGNSNELFFQVIDEEGRVSSFSAADVAPERIIVPGPEKTLTADVDAPAIIAVAMNSQHVLVGTRSSLPGNLRSYVNDNKQSLSPFDLLEFALFIGDDELIFEAASACKTRLEKVAPAIVGRWIDGSPVAENVKARLRTVPVASIREEPRSGTIRIGLSGPYRLMRTLTIFCEKNTSTSRASVVRGIYENDMRAHVEEASRAISLYAATVVKLLRRDASFPIESSRPSRGTVYAHVRDIDEYMDVIHWFRATVQRKVYNEIHEMPFYSNGEEHMNFMIVFCHFIRTYPSFLSFVESNSPR